MDASTARNPLLEYQPAYSYAMPVQLVAQSIVLSLTFVLIVHLLFTFRYHYPLAKLNYTLLSISALTSMTSSIVTTTLLLRRLATRSKAWPFMFEYVALWLPPSSWSTSQQVAWLFLEAVVTLSIHSTHIQFLTLLYPSTLERRLIFALLGPLAVISSGLSFTGIITTPKLLDLTAAVRATCNSSLTLLYSFGILLWALVVSRNRAWKTDGGTAAFGAAAIAFSLIGTAANFAEVKYTGLEWLSSIVWCTLLWQSWLAFWFWSGSGMYEGELEDRRLQQQKKLSKKLQADSGNDTQPMLSESFELQRMGSSTTTHEDSSTSHTTRSYNPIILMWRRAIIVLSAAHRQAVHFRAREVAAIKTNQNGQFSDSCLPHRRVTSSGIERIEEPEDHWEDTTITTPANPVTQRKKTMARWRLRDRTTYT